MDNFKRGKMGRFIKGTKPTKTAINNLLKHNQKLFAMRRKSYCAICDSEFSVPLSQYERVKCCSRKCGYIRRSENRRNGPHKPFISTQGYWFIKIHGHHRALKDGRVKIADIVAEEKLGRKLLKTEVVHHIDGDKQNDHPDNLEVMDKIEHDRYHTTLRHEKEALFGGIR